MAITLRQCSIAASIAVAVPTAVEGATNPKAVAVAARSLSFTEPKLSGSTPVAVVYQSGDKDSEADAQMIRTRLLSAGIAGISFQPSLVASDGLAAMTGVKAVVLADGLRRPETAFAAGARLHAVTVGFDGRCVQLGACVMSVQAVPTVEIHVSRNALNASGVRLSQAFLMLVKEQ